MASAPAALSANVAAWANIVFMASTFPVLTAPARHCAGSHQSLQGPCQLPESPANGATSRRIRIARRFFLPIRGQYCQCLGMGRDTQLIGQSAAVPDAGESARQAQPPDPPVRE